MIFALINNTYQLYDLSLHFGGLLNDPRLKIIVIPHSFRPDLMGDKVPDYLIESPFTKRFGLARPLSVLRSLHAIRQALPVGKNDVLLMYTENEILNHYVAKRFYSVGAKIFLLDEGVATYNVLMATPATLRSGRTRLKEWILRNVYGFRQSRYAEIDNAQFPLLDDSVFTAACLYFDLAVHIQRRIPTAVIDKNDDKVLRLDSHSAIFIGDVIDNMRVFYGVPATEYLEFLRTVVRSISKKLKVIYFKFHPRSPRTERIAIQKALAVFENVVFVSSDEPVETAIDRYSCKFALSLLSLSILNLSFRGVEAVFLYHLFDRFSRNNAVGLAAKFLHLVGYNFVAKLEDFGPDYRSALHDRRKRGTDLEQVIERMTKQTESVLPRSIG